MIEKFSIDYARCLDKKDPISQYRSQFNIPQFQNKDAVYFTGNSLGLQLKNHDFYLKQELEDWKSIAVEGHFHAKTPWFDYHRSLAADTAQIVGAKDTEVVTMNGLSVNLHLLLTSFYQPNKNCYKILCEPNLFPSDLYVLQSQIELRGFDPQEVIMFAPVDEHGVVIENELYSMIHANKSQLALVFLGGVNYYTGQVFDIPKITKIAHSNGIMVGFDLAHAAGNIELKLHEWGVDFAAWCSYKYLNSGPGAVSSVFIHEKQINKNPFRLSGWWGHKKSNRFELQNKFKPINTAEGWQLSNAPILSMSIYRFSLEFFNNVGIKKLITKRIKLSEYLEDAIKLCNQKNKFKIITPGNAKQRGAQLSIFISQDGNKIFNSLKKNGVYVDWREPNVMRIAPTPLYNSYEDIAQFYHILCQCI